MLQDILQLHPKFWWRNWGLFCNAFVLKHVSQIVVQSYICTYMDVYFHVFIHKNEHIF